MADIRGGTPTIQPFMWKTVKIGSTQEQHRAAANESCSHHIKGLIREGKLFVLCEQRVVLCVDVHEWSIRARAYVSMRHMLGPRA
eukprot:scaffold142727_cov32-Tisochrysis_lutea.AAC.4